MAELWCTECAALFTAKRSDAKFCTECRADRKRAQWHKWRDKPGNKEKIAEYSKAHEAQTNYRKAWRIKKLYGVSLEEYDALLADAVCGICDTAEDLCLDHCHATGVIRGVLCRGCNRSLGQLGDTAEAIKRVMDYLDTSNS